MYVWMIEYKRKNEVRNLRKFGINLKLIIVLHLLENFCPARILNKKFDKNEGKKNCTILENDVQKYVFSQ